MENYNHEKTFFIVHVNFFLYFLSGKEIYYSRFTQKSSLPSITFLRRLLLNLQKGGNHITLHLRLNQDVEVTYLFNDGNDKIFSWKIINYEHLHEGKKEEKNDCNCNKVAYRNQLTVYFRTDSLGAYKKINNLAQLRGNLLKNIAEQEKLLSKNDKNIFERVKRNPEGVISNIEEDIIIFSRYFGLENKNSVNTFFTRRNNFPFGLKSKPFKVVLSVLSEEKNLKINVKNEFDKHKAEDEDYNIF